MLYYVIQTLNKRLWCSSENTTCKKHETLKLTLVLMVKGLCRGWCVLHIMQQHHTVCHRNTNNKVFSKFIKDKNILMMLYASWRIICLKGLYFFNVINKHTSACTSMKSYTNKALCSKIAKCANKCSRAIWQLIKVFVFVNDSFNCYCFYWYHFKP